MTEAHAPSPKPSNAPDPSPPIWAAQPHNPLHGVTLQAMVTALADFYG